MGPISQSYRPIFLSAPASKSDANSKSSSTAIADASNAISSVVKRNAERITSTKKYSKII